MDKLDGFEVGKLKEDEKKLRTANICLSIEICTPFRACECDHWERTEIGDDAWYHNCHTTACVVQCLQG